jgi:hypothetical protein
MDGGQVGWNLNNARFPLHTVEYDLFIKSRFASRNSVGGLLWRKVGHVTPRNPAPTKPAFSTEWIVRSERERIFIERAVNVRRSERAHYGPKKT